MNKNIAFFIAAVVVAVGLAIGLHSCLQHSTTLSEIKEAIANLANDKDNPEAVNKAVRTFKEDDIKFWFQEMIEVYNSTESNLQKRNIMKVLGKKAFLIAGEYRDKTIALLEGAFADADETNAMTAIEVITRDYKNASSAEKLRLIIRGGDQRIGVKMAALEGLGRISPKDEDENMALLRGYMENEHAVLRMAAVKGLAEIRTVKVLEALYARLAATKDGAPAEQNLVVRMDLLRKVGELGNEHKNDSGDLCKHIVKYLEDYLRETSFISLHIQYVVTISADNIREMRHFLDIDLNEARDNNKLETGTLAATLEALYRLDAGDKYAVALKRMQSSETGADGRAILEGALINYFDFLLAPNGPDIPLSDVDRARLLSVCKRLAGLMDGDEATKAFAQDGLEIITGRLDIGSRDGWLNYLGKFDGKDNKFVPARRAAE